MSPSNKIPHLLYRLMNGELPASLQPKIYWVLIGTNDARMGCSSDVIAAGNIRIVQELQRHSSTRIPVVVNSLLPRGTQALSSPRNALWRILSTANQQLACYAALKPDVFFANVTDKFVVTRPDGSVMIHPERFSKDNLHTSALGSLVWQEFISDKANSLLAA